MRTSRLRKLWTAPFKTLACSSLNLRRRGVDITSMENKSKKCFFKETKRALSNFCWWKEYSHQMWRPTCSDKASCERPSLIVSLEYTLACLWTPTCKNQLKTILMEDFFAQKASKVMKAVSILDSQSLTSLFWSRLVILKLLKLSPWSISCSEDATQQAL